MLCCLHSIFVYGYLTFVIFWLFQFDISLKQLHFCLLFAHTLSTLQNAKDILIKLTNFRQELLRGQALVKFLVLTSFFVAPILFF